MRTSSTGCAQPAVRRAALHPRLQPAAPPGRYAFSVLPAVAEPMPDDPNPERQRAGVLLRDPARRLRSGFGLEARTH